MRNGKRFNSTDSRGRVNLNLFFATPQPWFIQLSQEEIPSKALQSDFSFCPSPAAFQSSRALLPFLPQTKSFPLSLLLKQRKFYVSHTFHCFISSSSSSQVYLILLVGEDIYGGICFAGNGSDDLHCCT